MKAISIALLVLTVLLTGPKTLAIGEIKEHNKKFLNPISLKDKEEKKETKSTLIAQALPSSSKDLQTRIEVLEDELSKLKTALQETKKIEKSKRKKNPLALNVGPDVRLRLNGYVQTRAFDNQATLDTSTTRTQFSLRRFRIGVIGDIGERSHIEYSFDLGRSAPVTPRDAFFDYRFTPWLLARIGQFKLPMGYEVLLSGSNVLFERGITTLKLFPSVRDRGFMWDADLSHFIHIPLSAQFAVVNGSGIGQLDNNSAKSLVGSLLYKKKNFDARVAFQTGRYLFEPDSGGSITTRKERLAFSLYRKFGFGKEKLWESYGAYTLAKGVFPSGKAALTGVLGTRGDYHNEDVRGFNVVAIRRLYPGSPVYLWLKYDNFDPNTHRGGDKIEIVSYGSRVHLTKYVSVLAGIFHKNFRNFGKDTSFGLQTQLKY